MTYSFTHFEAVVIRSETISVDPEVSFNVFLAYRKKGKGL